MKPLCMITWMLIRLSYRAKIAFFIMVVLPVGFFFLYCGLFAHGQPAAVEQLMEPLVILLAITSGLYGVGGTLVALREGGILHRFHLAPLYGVQMVLSNILSTYVTFIPIVVLMFGLAKIFYHLPLSVGTLVGLFAVLSFGYMAMGGISMVVAGLVNTAQESNIILQVLFFVLLFLSGSTVPIGHLPRLIQHFSFFLPPTLMIIAGQGILTAHQSLSQHIPELVGLGLIASSSLTLATAVFLWERGGHASPHRWRMAGIAMVPLLVVGIWLNTSASFHQTNNYLLNPSSGPQPAAASQPAPSSSSAR